MNIYLELKELIESNKLTITHKECYDAQSGWYGEDYYVYDPETNRRITNLSGNGYCFNDGSLKESIESIKKYILDKNLCTIDAFKDWCDSVATEVKTDTF